MTTNDFKEVVEILKNCQTVINGLAILREGFSYHPSSMLELSNCISVAIAKLETLEK
jgi:hypothetical protein